MKHTHTWKRILSIFMAVLMLLSVTPVNTYMDIRSNAASTDRIIYLNTGGSSMWNQAGAWFCAWVWGGSTADAMYKGYDPDGDGIYAFTIPSDATNIIFLRKNPANTGLDWNGEWNRVEASLTDNNCCTITGWQTTSFSWSKLTHSVNFSLSNVTTSGSSTATSGSAYSATLTAPTG